MAVPSAIAASQSQEVSAAPNPSAPPKISVQEYLAMERESDVRHEYFNGEIRAMAGESPRHNLIAGNIYRKFGNAFEDRPCSAYFEGVRLRVTPTQYRYPDVMALCGEAQFDTDNPPALLNPSVIVEVQSPSTQGFDRDEKFMEYRQIAEVTDYLMVAQDILLVVHFARQSATRWIVTEYSRLEESVTLESLGLTLSLADIYRKIVLGDALSSETPNTPASDS